MSECVPIPVTALLPLVLAPLLGVGKIDAIASEYGNPLIFLFLGGFLLSLAMERTSLHLRIARMTLLWVGSNPKAQLAGVMGITGFLSMWMSNTATALMMLPIALSIIALRREQGIQDRFAPSLLLGITYAASIGGMATLIGTPPNAFLAAYLKSSYGITLSFGHWMLFGVPFSLIFLSLAWLWLSRVNCQTMVSSVTRDKLKEDLRAMGRISQGEMTVAGVFLVTAFAWAFRSFLVDWTGLPFSDAGIAVTAGVSLFLFPYSKASNERVMEWKHAAKVPWGVLLLFGGGLALAMIIQESGLDSATGEFFRRMSDLPHELFVAAVVIAVIALTEVTSNTATTATLLPLLTPVAVALGGVPAPIAASIALAASCAFVMPVATPPNAIVFGTGEIPMREFIRAGMVLNIIGAIILIVSAVTIIPAMF